MRKLLCSLLVCLFLLTGLQGLALAEGSLVIAASANWIKDVDKELAQKFTDETGIAVEYQLTPDDQYSNVIKAKLSTGEGPDIFMVQSGVGMNEFLPDKNFLDLSDQPWVSRLSDWAKAGTTYKGKVIAMNLWSADGWAVLYDPAKFQKAGIDKAPATYEEFTAACDKLLAAGFTPLYGFGTAVWYQPLFLNAVTAVAAETDPDYMTKFNDNSLKLADVPAYELALTQLKEMFDKGYFGKDYMSTTWEDSVNAMASGEYGMAMVYTTYQNEILAAGANTGADKWEMFPLPLAGNRKFAMSAGGIVSAVNPASKNIDAAKQYLNFRTRLDNVEAFYKARADLGPSSMTDYQGATTLAYETVMKNSEGATPDLQGGMQFFDTTTLGKYFQEMYMGTKTPKQVLEAIDSDRQKMFDALG